MGRKWEEKYNQYKSGEMSSRVWELQEKVKNKTATREEYEELQRIVKIQPNISKVENILELKEKLQKELDEIKGEIARIQTLKDSNKKERTLEEEMNKITAEISRVEKELKRKDLTPEESEKLNQERTNLMAKRDSNNKEYQNIQKVFASNKDANTGKFSQMSLEDLNAKSFELSIKISKCNMVANNLMQGLPWDKIELNLDNWKSRKFTSKEKISEKAKTGKDSNFNDLEEKIIKETQRQIKEEAGKGKGIDDTELVDEIEELGLVNNFDIRHPRLAKIKNWFKEKFNKNKKIIVMDEETMPTEELGDSEENKENKDNEFKKYIKEVAEKGMEGIAREKMDKLKREAHARETEKFGKEYADNSYTIEDEGR